MTMKLRPEETILKGEWKLLGNAMQRDEVCIRIEKLISKYLIKLGADESGWEILYQDPEDERYWELSYPDSEMQGGGPPLLKQLSTLEAKKKYSSILIENR
jgi:hypothetical protein